MFRGMVVRSLLLDTRERQKPTCVSLVGLAAAREHIETLRADAHAALAGFGTTARRLNEIAERIAPRKN